MESPPASWDPTIAQLLLECPGLIARWQAERPDSDDEPGPYAQAAALAAAIVDAYRSGNTSCFGPLFKAVDVLVISGDEAVAELVVIGLLEDLQNELLWESLELNVFQPWMGAEAQRAWNELIVFWNEIRAKKASGQLPSGPFDQQVPEVKNPKLRRLMRSNIRPFK